MASGVPGSGVRSLRVNLIDAYGRPVGSSAEIPFAQSGSWDTELTLTDPIAGGAYTLRFEADDQVGNRAVTDTRIYLDQNAPDASLVGLPPGGAKLVLHLDESTGSKQFADSSGYGHNFMCGAACPAAGLAGKYGLAVGLDGLSQSLALNDALNAGPSDFTLAAWFKSGSHTWQTILSASTTGNTGARCLVITVDQCW